MLIDAGQMTGAAAKAAGMRLPHEMTDDRAEPKDQIKDDRSRDWHPARISDRKLLELADQLESMRSLGGAFACIALSDQAQHRLVDLEAQPEDP